MSSIITSIDAFTHQGFTAPGTPNHYSEDRLVITPGTFAVIDGATAATADQMGNLNTSAYTAQFLATFLARHDHTTHSAGDLLLMANKQFAAHLTAAWPHILRLGKLGPCAAVVVVRFHEHAITLASLADCAIVGLMDDGLWHLLSDPDTRHGALDDKLAAAAQAEIARGLTPQQARKAPAVVAMNEKHRNLMNIEYGVFNAEPEVATFLHTATVDLARCKALALFSDGMLWPESATDAEAFTETARRMHAQGARAYYQTLQEKYDGDPAFTRYPRLKHMDDATGMVLRLA